MPSFKIKFLWVTILQGVKFSIFLLISEWALQQCSATALPAIVNISMTVGLIFTKIGNFIETRQIFMLLNCNCAKLANFDDF